MATRLCQLPSGGALNLRIDDSSDPWSTAETQETHEAWRGWLAGHRVAERPSASYHPAATRPDACALATRDFFLGLARQPAGMA